MNFNLTKEQTLAKELFYKFAENEIRPIAKDMDETEVYSLDLVAKMQATGAKVIAADALAIAREAGSEKAVNVALIGMAAHALGIDDATLREAVKMSVPEKFLELNLKAFDLGANHSA